MRTLAVILARAGSKGLVGKNTAPVAGRPMVAWTISHALAAESLDHVALSTDGRAIADVGRAMGVPIITRPDDLAHDTATVDAAARHALHQTEQQTGHTFDAVVILYANVPVRPGGLIDNAVATLQRTGCDSVQSLCPVGKMHPYWMKQLTGDEGDRDRIQPHVPNRVYRRQDLPPLHMLDGGLIALRRASLLRTAVGEPHAFLGSDQRAIVTEPGAVVDVDTAADLAVAGAILRDRLTQQPPTLTIGERVVSRDTARTYVIAELGVNHDGSLDRARELVHAAKQAGADAIKVQVFNADALLSEEAQLAAYQAPAADDPKQMLAALQLDEPALHELRAEARRLDLGFIATCFSPADAAVLRRLEVDAVKLASSDAVNLPLLQAAAELTAPVIVSTGACDASEIQRLHLHLTRLVGPSHAAVVMHCISAYPTATADANLRWIEPAAGLEHVGGFSDHTTQLEAGMLAVAAGAKVIEKHLTHDRTAPGPDHAASFDPPQFARYVALIRTAEQMLGPGGERRVLAAEEDVRRVARQSVCTTRPLEKGHRLTAADLTIKRPGTAIPAAHLNDLIGRPLRRNVPANTLLREDDIAPPH